ncbi:MAG: AAA family ATPase, partial [Candidatus Electrothrix sp. AUS4]|nr:AAA family ATPase [Candidatus Electrothrix sp. AUS4]
CLGGGFNILLRPRRFGKSLFLSTLWHYYDVRSKDEFDALFGGLAAGRNPTPLRNSYQVLFMEFSGIGDSDNDAVERDFLFEVHKRLRIFLEDYQYPDETIRRLETRSSPASLMKLFFEIIREEKIYLLIDEYDHFANSILGTSPERFQEIIGRGGFVRSFYETIKTATMEGIVDRFFITGVTSITLDSLTSGFNIGNNITHHRAFHQAVGFTREEVETAVRPLADACDLEQRELMKELSRWYNGYRFSTRAQERLFNADMVLYFIKNFDKETCLYPERMLDDNIASDYRKIMQLFGIGDRAANFKILEELITVGEVVGGGPSG